jgi:purine-nucleoside phosphorylase
MPAPGAGTVTVIVPVLIVQVGCEVTVAVGAAGAVGTALIVSEVAVDTQPVTEFEVVTSYIPGARPANMPVAFVTGATTGLVPVTV